MVDRSPMLNNLVQMGQQQYNSHLLKAGGGGSILSELVSGSSSEEQKFNIVPVDCLISNKTMIMQQKPSKTYIEIQFNKDSEVPYFHYIVLQNFYTYSVTIKQCKTGQNPKNESSWVTILKDYQLMRNAHFETDAQNWHILGTELVSTLFD